MQILTFLTFINKYTHLYKTLKEGKKKTKQKAQDVSFRNCPIWKSLICILKHPYEFKACHLRVHAWLGVLHCLLGVTRAARVTVCRCKYPSPYMKLRFISMCSESTRMSAQFLTSTVPAEKLRPSPTRTLPNSRLLQSTWPVRLYLCRMDVWQPRSCARLLPSSCSARHLHVFMTLLKSCTRTKGVVRRGAPFCPTRRSPQSLAQIYVTAHW